MSTDTKGISDEQIGEIWREPENYMQPINFARAIIRDAIDRVPEAAMGDEWAEIIEIYLKLHEGKIGAHWIWCVIEQMAAGVPEDEAMRGYGYYSTTPPAALQDRIDTLNSSLECEKRMRKDAEEYAELYRHLRSTTAVPEALDARIRKEMEKAR